MAGPDAAFQKEAGELIGAGVDLGAARTMAESGLRVLAMADGEVSGEADDAVPSGLRASGLVGMIDPLRPDAAEAVRRCREAGVSLAIVTGDHPATALAIARDLGPVDILIPNATPAQPLKPIEEYDWAFYQSMLDFFVKSPYLLTRAVLPHMKQQRWGRIVTLGGISWHSGLKRRAHRDNEIGIDVAQRFTTKDLGHIGAHTRHTR